MSTPLEERPDTGLRPRKAWDIALTVVLLVMAAPFVMGVLLLDATSLLFADSCSGSCDVLSADSPLLALGAFTVAVWLAGTIVSIVLLAVRRRAWWVAGTTLAAILGPVIVLVAPSFVDTLAL